jgi:DNA-binding transcriptional regulator YdaS (Cro superfamily)
MHLRDYLKNKPRGTGSALAAALKVQRVLVSQWAAEKSPRPVPQEHCAPLERETAGEVTAEEMRPDLPWLRVKDRKWPNPKGKPMCDFSAVAA